MKIHTITKDQLDKNNNYVGNTDLTDFKGHLESDENLGCVKFKSLKIGGRILFKAGSGIKSSGEIIAGHGITSGKTVEAKGGIISGLGILAIGEIVSGGVIKTPLAIVSGEKITARLGFKKVIAKSSMYKEIYKWMADGRKFKADGRKFKAADIKY